MFSRISAFLTVAIAAAASARMERHTHVLRNNPSAPSHCNTGYMKCCNSVYNVGFFRFLAARFTSLTIPKATDIASILDMLSYSYDPADTIGVSCTPLNIYGAGEAASCLQQPVCCSNNTYVSRVLALRRRCVSSLVCRNPGWQLQHQLRVFSDERELDIALHESLVPHVVFFFLACFRRSICS